MSNTARRDTSVSEAGSYEHTYERFIWLSRMRTLVIGFAFCYVLSHITDLQGQLGLDRAIALRQILSTLFWLSLLGHFILRTPAEQKAVESGSSLDVPSVN